MQAATQACLAAVSKEKKPAPLTFNRPRHMHGAGDVPEVVVEASQVLCFHPQVCLCGHGVAELADRVAQIQALYKR